MSHSHIYEIYDVKEKTFDLGQMFEKKKKMTNIKSFCLLIIRLLEILFVGSTNMENQFQQLKIKSFRILENKTYLHLSYQSRKYMTMLNTIRLYF